MSPRDPDQAPPPPSDPEGAAAEESEQARRRARIFGDVLPEETQGRDGGESSEAGEDWLRANIPPHHGD